MYTELLNPLQVVELPYKKKPKSDFNTVLFNLKDIAIVIIFGRNLAFNIKVKDAQSNECQSKTPMV